MHMFNKVVWASSYKLATQYSRLSLALTLLAATCHLLINIAKSLDQYQDQQNVGPDLDPNIFTLW